MDPDRISGFLSTKMLVLHSRFNPCHLSNFTKYLNFFPCGSYY